MNTTQETRVPGVPKLDPVLEPEKFYSLKHAQAVTGIKQAGFRKMRDEGLRVHYLGRTAWVAGNDLIAHIISKSKKSR